MEHEGIISRDIILGRTHSSIRGSRKYLTFITTQMIQIFIVSKILLSSTFAINSRKSRRQPLSTLGHESVIKVKFKSLKFCAVFQLSTSSLNCFGFTKKLFSDFRLAPMTKTNEFVTALESQFTRTFCAICLWILTVCNICSLLRSLRQHWP